KYGGTRILDYRHAGGKNGGMELHLYVYKQPGCKEGGRQNEKKNIATRKNHYFSVCQKKKKKGKIPKNICLKGGKAPGKKKK
ncbi:hypothetical protein EU74_14920, partial [Staphylococcus aureus]